MYLTVTEASKQLGISKSQIRKLLREDKLDGELVGSQWIISKKVLQAYVKENPALVSLHDRKRTSDKLPKIVALSFFTGAMGLDIGMEQGGIKPLLASEIDKSTRATIVENRPEIGLIGDVSKYSSEEILEMARVPKGRNIDVIFGGPPCQAFSTAGNRKGFSDSRGNVFLRFIDLIEDMSPTYVVIENVRGLLSAPHPYPSASTGSSTPVKGGALLHILERLRAAGYTISFELYNSANFGVPQLRERVILIAYRGEQKVKYLTPTHSNDQALGLPAWRTLADAFSTIPGSKIHTHVEFPEKRLRFYRLLKAGQYWKDLPLELQEEAMGKSFHLGGGKTGFYRRLAFDRPSPTLVTHPAMPATDLCHPVEERPLSVEEYKAIQEFPEEWRLHGTLIEQYRQLGNAVPIRLGKAIAEAILSHMKGEPQENLPGFRYSRYHNTNEVAWENTTREKLGLNQAKQVRLF